MIWLNIKRVCRAGFVNFWRNGFVSLASVLIMVITLFVIGSVLLSGALFSSSLEQIKQRVDVNVYFVTSAKEADILSVKKTLEAMPEVANVSYVSREQALADFKKRHENEETTLSALEELGENPLGASLNIKAKDPSQYEGVAAFLQSKDFLTKDGVSIVDSVNYKRNKEAINALTRFMNSAERLGFALTAVLVVISIVVAFNTVRLAIFVSREEISIMRLVGASNKYVRGPFVVTGLLYGLIAALITLVLLYPVTFWLGRATENFFTGINLFRYYLANFPQLGGIILLSGMAMGAVSSYLAVRRHLKI